MKSPQCHRCVRLLLKLLRNRQRSSMKNFLGLFIVFIKVEKRWLLLISISVSMFGFVLVMFELEKIFDEFMISQNNQRRVCIFIISFLVLLGYFIQNLVSIWMVIALLVFSLKAFPIFFMRWLETNIQSSFQGILDDLILGVQSGKSLQQSLEQCLKFKKNWEFHLWKELHEILQKRKALQQVKSEKKRRVFAEIVEIQQAQVRLLEQLKSVRHVVKQQNDFRRKSGAATQQIRVQSLILTLLFVSSLIFTLKNFGFYEYWKLILACSALFSLGLIVQSWLLRSRKWKI